MKHGQKTFGLMDLRPNKTQPKRQNAVRQMTVREIADKHKIEKIFGRKDF